MFDPEKISFLSEITFRPVPNLSQHPGYEQILTVDFINLSLVQATLHQNYHVVLVNFLKVTSLTLTGHSTVRPPTFGFKN